jgi:hypothetical protein|tara:strand:+ start:368 stop:709 length:342 start_codon:yes stop_codon:yes gene_type:complete
MNINVVERYNFNYPLFAVLEDFFGDEVKGREIMIGKKRLDEWMKKAKTGDKITYFRGYLCDPWLQPYDRVKHEDHPRINRFQKYVYDLYEMNKITLVQKRHGDWDYEYMAIKK